MFLFFGVRLKLAAFTRSSDCSLNLVTPSDVLLQVHGPASNAKQIVILIFHIVRESPQTNTISETLSHLLSRWVSQSRLMGLVGLKGGTEPRGGPSPPAHRGATALAALLWSSGDPGKGGEAQSGPGAPGVAQ